MIHSASEQSSNDCHTDVKCSQPQEKDHSSTEIHVEHPPIDDATTSTELQLSKRTSTVLTDIVPADVIYRKTLLCKFEIQNLVFNSDKPIEPVPHCGDETIGSATTDVGHQTECDIDRQIVAMTKPTLPKSLSAKDEFKRSQKELTKFLKNLAESNGESKKFSDNDSDIPSVFTEFNYYGKTIPVRIEQFYNAPLLGEGAFGKVYDVNVEGLPNNRMAVKRICRLKQTELTTMKLVASGKCQYIIKYYCALTSPNTNDLFICMERMTASMEAFHSAMHLLGAIVSNKFDGLIRRITHDIATALKYLESEKITHQDVKPANMLIDEKAIIKLCDFSISHSFSKLKSNLKVIGATANYAPAERDLSIQDDMWAFGISLYEVVDGKNPFANNNSYGKCFTIKQWQPSVLTKISDGMWKIISNLLENNARLRPQSYGDILKEQCILDVTETPSSDECDFVRNVIETIPRNGCSG